jgi:hypothetical protein
MILIRRKKYGFLASPGRHCGSPREARLGSDPGVVVGEVVRNHQKVGVPDYPGSLGQQGLRHMKTDEPDATVTRNV